MVTYAVGDKLEYLRPDGKSFIIEIIKIDEDRTPPYWCKVLKGPWSVGDTWRKTAKILRTNYVLVDGYTTHKQKLKI